MNPPRPMAVALVLLAGCAGTQEGREELPEVTPEARQMLDRAFAHPDASAVVVDLRAVEEAGLASRDDAVRQTVNAVEALLPFLLSRMEGEPESQQMVGRFMVAARALSQWSEWPKVSAWALVLPRLGDKGNPATRGVVVLAVDRTRAEAETLLAGLLALGRAALAGEHGQDVTLELSGKDACVTDVTGRVPPVCVRAGPGFLLAGTREAMDAFAGSPVPAVVPLAEGQVPLLARARVAFFQQGEAELFLRGEDTLVVEAEVRTEDPVTLARVEQMVKGALAKYDADRDAQRAVLASALADVQAKVAADPAAPADLKTATAALTVQRIVDPHGYWQAVRQSVTSARTAGRYRASLTVPAGAVEDLRELARSGGATGLSTLGMMAGIAVPNFLKFQCRSKQAEAKANLRAIAVAQRAHGAEKAQYGVSFSAIGFRPEPNTRYTYCMGQDCLSCTHESCAPVQGEHPCVGMSGVGTTLEDGFQVCAYANLDQDPAWDVWLVDESGAPQMGQSDCED